MHKRLSLYLTGVAIFSFCADRSGWTHAVESRTGTRPYGIQHRVPWTTSKIFGTPDPPSPYRTEVAFTKLKFEEPLNLVAAPGTDRLFVAERFGTIRSFNNDPNTSQSQLFMDLANPIYGMAFHPRFKENGYFYVMYVVQEDAPNGSRLARFRVDPDNWLRGDLKSEELLFIWPSGGHNGGCIVFGPDGYLYLATGDGSGIADSLQTGQNLGDVRGKILRLDVDRRDPGLAYAIPPDNPFASSVGARPEIWAYGLRQAWKMSFDRQTGDLWAGNVGQDLWEQIYLIQRGGNYGWSVTEGSHAFRPDRKQGPTPILPPVVEHDHAAFRSITGGYVYRGARLKELTGAYIYADYDTGRIWSFRHDGREVRDHQELFDSNLRIVAFGQDDRGEVYLVDHTGGRIHQLVAAPKAESLPPFPRRLSETGLFISVANHQVAPGVIPYSVNAPVWSDGAIKQRFLALPGDSTIELDAITYPQPAPGAPPGWKFPGGTVLMETISMEMETGVPSRQRRLETRILHHIRTPGSEEVGDQVWHGYTYVWNSQQTDATLLEDPRGQDKVLHIRDPESPGGIRQQTWHFPSRAECTVCHNMAAKYVLGVNTLQINKDHDYGGINDNQLRAWEHIGLFDKPLPYSPEQLPRLAVYSDVSEDSDQRARAYMHANCAHCHRKWGGGNADFQLLTTLPSADMGIINTRPGQGDFYLEDAKIVKPADPFSSVLFYRTAKLGSGRMPRIGSTVVDTVGLDLIHNWITRLPFDDSPVATQTDGEADRSSLPELDVADPTAQISDLLSSTSGALRLLRAVDSGVLTGELRQRVIARATQSPLPHVRDLFERFIPEEKRTKRLGSVVDPNEILALPGDSDRGERVFFDTAGVQCKTCHRIHGKGGLVGPDLSQIGKKYTRSQMLETILQPSKDIDPKYLSYRLETTAGTTSIGVLVEKIEKEIVLRDAQDKEIRVDAVSVERLTPQKISLMPELLLRDLTARQVADLTEYLSRLK